MGDAVTLGYPDRMRWALFPLLSLLPLGAAASSDRPVLVELFTSDACPACPAVDALIQKLTAPGAVPGAEVVALEWHTDTLNTEVWSDGLALPDGIRRQVDYLVRLIHMKSPVMPQIIVGGRQSLVGPEETDIRTAIAGDVHEPPFAISVSALSGCRPRSPTARRLVSPSCMARWCDGSSRSRSRNPDKWMRRRRCPSAPTGFGPMSRLWPGRRTETGASSASPASLSARCRRAPSDHPHEHDPHSDQPGHVREEENAFLRHGPVAQRDVGEH